MITSVSLDHFSLGNDLPCFSCTDRTCVRGAGCPHFPEVSPVLLAQVAIFGAQAACSFCEFSELLPGPRELESEVFSEIET